MAPARFSEAEVARRLPLWYAMACLFLDTEPTDGDYRAIAGAIVEAGFSADEAQAIFLEEVAPAFAPNLLVVAGEWAGWPDDLVRERVLKSCGSPFARAAARVLGGDYLAAQWARIADGLEG